jgi:hypothetical protein
LIQESGAEICHLAGERAGPRRARAVENRCDLPAGDFVDVVADGPAVFAGRNDGRLQPRAVGVAEKVVARPDVCVDGALERRTGRFARRLRPNFTGRKRIEDE